MSVPAAAPAPALTVIVVSYNTRALTLKCLQTLHAATHETAFRTVVFDNASTDGSAAAIAAAFPQVELIANDENLGFAAANNRVAAQARTEWLLLLNPDTEVHDGAVDRLLAFARAHPRAGITGGRTVFPDGSLNIASCWNRITPWSAFCNAAGLSSAFPRSSLFNPEAIGGWARDSVREVDIVVGCFLMIRRDLWNDLGGFDLKYFMYGEEADLCLRARAMGFRPMITPEAEIMHLVGASSTAVARKYSMIAKARVTLIRDHWPRAWVPFGLAMMRLWAGSRAALLGGLARLTGRKRDAAAKWAEIWRDRHDWLEGYTMTRTGQCRESGATPPAAAPRKRLLARPRRFVRLVWSVIDPRAWAHLVKLVNYYNYTHVQPMRKITLGPFEGTGGIAPNVSIANPERITIGARAAIGANCHLWAGHGAGGRIVIGDDVLMGPEVMISASGYRYNDGAPVTLQPMEEAEIVIGNDVWLGTRAIVLPGARIGDGCVIGAGAVVRGEIPPFSVAVGMPARIVSTRRRKPDQDPAQPGDATAPSP